jgi:hypothetical protein
VKKYFASLITLIVFSSALALASPQPKVKEHVLDLSAHSQQVTSPEFSNILGVVAHDGKAVLVTREPQAGDGTTRTFNLVVVKGDEDLPPGSEAAIPAYVGSVSISGTLYHIFLIQ